MALCLDSGLSRRPVLVANKFRSLLIAPTAVVVVPIVRELVPFIRRVVVIDIVAVSGFAVVHFQRIWTQLNQLGNLLDRPSQINGILQEVVLFQVGAEDDVLLVLAVVVDLGLRGLVVIVVGESGMRVVDGVVIPTV